MTKTVKLSLLAIFIFQIIISFGFELAHDEAYYWLYSRHLDWGYFDHPPFVGVVIKLFSFLPHSEFAVRLGFILLQFATLIILLAMTGWHFAPVLLFFSFPLASMAGLLALPDIPLLFMCASYCYLLKLYLEDESIKRSSLLGLCIALLFYAKYHGVLLIFFTILAIPKLLLKRSFYLVAAVALLFFLPHLLWQYQHDFATLRYHFLERPAAKFSLGRSAEYIGLQIILAGVFVGPVIWWKIIKARTTDTFDRAMKFIAIGTVLFFLVSSFSKKIEANWTIFLAVPIIYLVASPEFWEKKWKKILLISSFAIVLGIRILFVLPPEMVSIKRIKEFKGWEKWAVEVRTLCVPMPIMANSYQIASKLSYYLNTDVGALNYYSRKNQFDYWKFEQNIPTKEVCYLTDKPGFIGESIETPEGKRLQVVKNLSVEALLKLKYESKR